MGRDEHRMERRSRNWVRVGRVGSEGVRQDRVEGQSRQRGRVGSEVAKADRAGGAKGQCGQRASTQPERSTAKTTTQDRKDNGQQARQRGRTQGRRRDEQPAVRG